MDRRQLLGLWLNAIENGNKKEEKRIMDIMTREQKNYSKMRQKRGFFTKKKKGDKQMRRQSFLIHCSLKCINPSIALENEKIIKALRKRDDKKVIELLKTEF